MRLAALGPILRPFPGYACVNIARLKWPAVAGCVGGAFAVAIAAAVSAETIVTTVPVPGGGQPVCARTDSRGAIHLLFNSPAGAKYAKSLDGGKTFGEPISVVQGESQTPGLQFSAADMALGRDGSVHVAMDSNAWKLKLPKQEWAFYYARLDSGGEAFSPPQNINRTPSEGFSLAADDKGRVTACWLSGKLFANVSRDNGKTFAAPVEIDTTIDPCDCCTTSCVYAQDGRLAVLYREETDNKRDMFLVLWDQDRNEVSRTQVSRTPWHIQACPMSYYAVACSEHGFVAIWPTKGQIYFTRLDSKGAAQGPAEIKTPGTTGRHAGLFAASDREGNTVVAWKKDGQLTWQVYDPRGQPSGPPISAESAGNGVAGALRQSGEFVLFR
jgi:hypothetical protein